MALALRPSAASPNMKSHGRLCPVIAPASGEAPGVREIRLWLRGLRRSSRFRVDPPGI